MFLRSCLLRSGGNKTPIFASMRLTKAQPPAVPAVPSAQQVEPKPTTADNTPPQAPPQAPQQQAQEAPPQAAQEAPPQAAQEAPPLAAQEAPPQAQPAPPVDIATFENILEDLRRIEEASQVQSQKHKQSSSKASSTKSAAPELNQAARIAALEARLVHAYVGGAAPYKQIIAGLEHADNLLFSSSTEFRYRMSSVELVTEHLEYAIEKMLLEPNLSALAVRANAAALLDKICPRDLPGRKDK